MLARGVFALAGMAALGAATTGISQGFAGNGMAGTTSRIIQNMSTCGPSVTAGFGTALRCGPVVPGGCNSSYRCRNSCGGFGGYGGFGFPVYFVSGGSGGYYGNYYGGGYQDYSLALENQRLRERLDRLEQQQQLANGNPAVNVNVPPKNANRQRVEKERADGAMKAGKKLFQRGSYAAAAQKFETAAGLDPLDSAPRIYLAQAQFAAGQYGKAAQTLKAVLQLTPDWPQAEADVRGMYGDGGDLVKQMGDLAQHLKANPLDADAMFLLGFELFVTGEIDRSRKLFEQSARLSPEDSHLKPFFDYFTRRDGLPPPPAPRDNADAGPIPVPDLLLAGGKGAAVRK